MPAMPEDDLHRHSLRLPRWLYERLVVLAQAERRSVNNLFMRVLEQYVQSQDKPDGKPQSP